MTQEILHQIRTPEQSRSHGKLVIITGATASGKSHAKSILEERGIGRIISATTRRKRGREKGGRDYHFLSREDFESRVKRGLFVEWNEYGGNLYGTPKSELELLFEGKNLIHSTDIEGAVHFLANVRESYNSDPGKADLLLTRITLAFIGVDSLFTARSRYLRRENELNITQQARDTFRERIRTDWEMWQKYGSSFNHIIINETGAIKETADKVEALFLQ